MQEGEKNNKSFIGVRVSTDLYDELDKRSFAKGIRNLSLYIRQIIQKGLEAEKKQEEAAK